jgi:hypothetical protein
MDIEKKLELAEQKLLQDTSVSTTNVPTTADVTMDEGAV